MLSPYGNKNSSAQAWALRYGSSRKPLVVVVPDSFWPDMCRLTWPDGQISDMANLSRAKDAAEVICANGPPKRRPKLLSWKVAVVAQATGSPPIAAIASAASDSPLPLCRGAAP